MKTGLQTIDRVHEPRFELLDPKLSSFAIGVFAFVGAFGSDGHN